MEATCCVAELLAVLLLFCWNESRDQERMKLRYKLQGNVIGEYSRTCIIIYMNKLIFNEFTCVLNMSI